MDESKYVSDIPLLMSEWDWGKNRKLGLDPYTLKAQSNKKAWWICSVCKNEWQATISPRTNGVGCPFCSNRKVKAGFNDLATKNPKLAKEWHPTKNGGLSPSEVTPGSDKKVWWIGPCGHEWEAKICNRNRGADCPYCRSQKLSRKSSAAHIRHSGTLADSNPNLAKQWHPTKNMDLSPTDITAKSPKVVWWIGDCGHEWQARVVDRNSGHGCPFCSNQKVLAGFNDLQSKFPQTANEWHPTKNGDLKPTNVLYGSNKKVWWLGTCGHEWIQSISNRTLRNQGCPICAQKLQTSFPEQAIFYYLKSIFPDAENGFTNIFENDMELDIYIPSISLGIEYDGANWHDNTSLQRESTKYHICVENHIFLIRVREEVRSVPEDICNKCFFVKRHPSAHELDYLISEICNYLCKSCDINTERDAIKIREQYYGTLKSHSLLKLRPEIAREWNYTKNGNLTPDMFTIYSGVRVWWKCPKCGREWQAPIARRSQGRGCPDCGISKRATSQFANRLNTQGSLLKNNPELAAEWHPIKNGPLQPDMVMQSGSQKVWWLCKKCGYEWQATINSRDRGSGCPQCAKLQISKARKSYMLKKNGSLKDRNPLLALEWNYEKNMELLPDMVTACSHKIVWWKCPTCGHEWQAEIKARNYGAKCPHCAHHKQTK